MLQPLMMGIDPSMKAWVLLEVSLRRIDMRAIRYVGVISAMNVNLISGQQAAPQCKTLGQKVECSHTASTRVTGRNGQEILSILIWPLSVI